jgi:hypothetical protein
MSYLPEETILSKKKNNRRRRKNKARQSPEESVNMINTLRSEYDTSSLHYILPRRMI